MLEFEEDSLFVPLTDDINPDEKLSPDEPTAVPDSV